jgi:hypothetical protein
MAFKIVGWQQDSRGGSYLPNLIIEIIDPDTIDLSKVIPYTGNSGGGLVRLVK